MKFLIKVPVVVGGVVVGFYAGSHLVAAVYKGVNLLRKDPPKL